VKTDEDRRGPFALLAKPQRSYLMPIMRFVGNTIEVKPQTGSPKMFLFFSNVHQKSVNKGQIIPVFTLFCDDK
jgi:hypothetical protein